MNHITQRNNLEKQKMNYIRFMKICPENSVTKLSKEIMKIEDILEKLREYDLAKLMKPIEFQYETKQSKMNKESFEPQTDLLSRIIAKDFLTT